MLTLNGVPNSNLFPTTSFLVLKNLDDSDNSLMTKKGKNKEEENLSLLIILKSSAENI